MAKEPKEDSRKTRRLLRRTTALSTAVGLYLAAPYIDMATDSYDLPPMPDCGTHSSAILAEHAMPSVGDAANAAMMHKLANEPASAESLIVQAILNKGGTSGRLKSLLDNELELDVKHAKSAESQAYESSCDYRGELIDIQIENPLLRGAEGEKNYLQFKAIANYDDEPSANKVVAYFEPDSGTLLISTVGLTRYENHDRAIAAITGNTERLVPYEFAEKFIAELRDQVREQGLQVNHTSILSHSLGTAGGVLMKGMLEDSMANKMVFGKNPSLTMVEGFAESLAADDVVEKLGIDHEKLTRNSVSVRSGGDGTANIITTEWGDNQTIGREVYAISCPDNEDNHRMDGIAKGLIDGTRSVEPYEGTFRTEGSELVKGQGAEFVGKLAKLGREIRQQTGLG